MKTIKHSIKLETVLDEKHEVAMRMLALPTPLRNAMINQMVNDLLVPKIEPILEELNKNGSYAILKVRQQ
jgi:hypothetical protein